MYANTSQTHLETRNAWQSLAYSLLRNAVSPRNSETTVLPPGECAKNARPTNPPSLLSGFTQHYLVAMAMSLDKGKIRYRSIIYTQSAFILRKDCEN